MSSRMLASRLHEFSMALLKSALKSLLRPARVAGGRFFIRPPGPPNYSETIIWKAAQMVSSDLVEGDYIEFGVYNGGSLTNAFRAIRAVYEERASDQIHSEAYRKQVVEQWNRMRFFAFDSFQGLPKLAPVEGPSKEFEEGKFAYRLADVQRNLRANDVDLSKIVFVPGWFEQTCTAETIQRHGMKAASIVHIDCDLYESARVALKFVEPLMVDGTVLIFDDWYCFRGNPDRGEQRAFGEWWESKPEWQFTEYQKEGPWRNSFIASRKSASPACRNDTSDVKSSF
jgi:O-methyltransferase